MYILIWGIDTDQCKNEKIGADEYFYYLRTIHSTMPYISLQGGYIQFGVQLRVSQAEFETNETDIPKPHSSTILSRAEPKHWSHFNRMTRFSRQPRISELYGVFTVANFSSQIFHS